ncbi:MAG: alanine racemase [Myxococcales bacterium]|nr:alanine racemase [Myxococcales bacterium]
MELRDVPTPAAVVDLARVEHNCAGMAERARALGVSLRPHVKTHKCVEAARLSVAGHFGGITVSTLAEARAFAAAGFRDITYAVPLSLARMDEAVALAAEVDRLGLLVDHADAAIALAEAGRRHDRVVDCWLKVDCGYHRAGVIPGTSAAEQAVAAIVGRPELAFAGLLTHAGHSYACRDRAAITEVAAEERRVVVDFAAALRARGIEVPAVSLGSTPTLSVAEDLTGVTEVRPGNYVFYDAFQAAIGSCRLEDAAFSVLTSVIGHHPDRLVIDAGALALSKDPGIEGETPSFGVVADLEARPIAGLRLGALSQEHGIIHGPPSALAERRLGERLRIIANHSCLAAACHPELQVVRGPEVVERWHPLRGW